MITDIKNNGLKPSIVTRNPIAATLISKFTRDSAEQPMQVGNLNLSDVAAETDYKIRNNDDILTMFPDIELAIQILTASILSPNDMIKTTLTYSNPNIRMPAAVSETILNTIEDYIESNYSLSAKLSQILKEALCTKGAYIEAIIPEASLDDIIAQQNFIDNNAGIESYFKPTGQFLFNSKPSELKVNISRESADTIRITAPKENSKQPVLTITEEDLGITITDNYKALNLNKLLVKSLKLKNKKKLHRVSTEDIGTTAQQLEEQEKKKEELDAIFRDKTYYEQQDYVKVNTGQDASRRSLTKPLILNLPIQSVIPVHVPGEPSKHLGYFVIIDENGNPLQYTPEELEANTIDYYSSSNLEQDTRLNLIQKARGNLIGTTSPDIMLDNLETIYTQLVDSMLRKKLEDSDYKDLVTMEKHTDLYRVMLFRALRFQQTKVVFIPEELVAYYAFEYRDNGTGKSLLEKSSIFFSLKAILLFSRIMAALKNGTSITEVTANLDEHDIDPQARIEQIKSEVLKTRQSALPLGVIRPDDLADWVQKNGLRFKFTHPSLTDLDISTSDMTVSKSIPDEDLETKLNEYIYMSLFLTPEIVEAGYSTDYATTVVAKQLLFAKRIIRLQDTFTYLLTDHVRKLLVNDVVLINEIKGIVKENLKDIRKFINKVKEDNPFNKDGSKKEVKKKTKISIKDIEDYVIDSYLNELVVTLPEPEVDRSTNIKQAFDEYKTMLEETLDIVFNTSAIPNDYIGNIADKVDSIKEMYKAASLMKWMSNNGYMPELSEAVTKDDEGNFIFAPLEEYSHFLESLAESFLPFITKQTKIKPKLDEKLEKAETPPEESSSSDSGDDNNEDNEGEDDDMEDNNDDATDDEGGGDSDAADALKSMDNMDADGDDTGDDSVDDSLGDMEDSLGELEEDTAEEEGKGNADDMEKLQALLLKERIDKERALAERAKAEAIDKMKKYGITPKELEDMSKSNVKVNPDALYIERPEPKEDKKKEGEGDDPFGMDDMDMDMGDMDMDMGGEGGDDEKDALASMENMDSDGEDKKDKDKEKKEGESKEDLEQFIRTRKIFRI